MWHSRCIIITGFGIILKGLKEILKSVAFRACLVLNYGVFGIKPQNTVGKHNLAVRLVYELH